MVDKSSAARRPPGRPPSFDRDAALQQAMEMFWADGYDGVDVERIARAIGITKPSLYRAFGDKAALFFRAVERYAQTYGAVPMAAFDGEEDIALATRKFCEAAVRAATSQDGRTGCMMACAIAGSSGDIDETRAFLASGLAATGDLLAARFERETKTGRLSRTISPRARGRLLVDLMQGMAVRARAGVQRDELLTQVRTYVPLVLA